MKSLIKQFHLENKEVIEVSTVVFVITGLILNINPTSRLGIVSIGQISFFLLFSSVLLLAYLLFGTYIFFMRAFVNKNQLADIQYLSGVEKIKNEMYQVSKIVLVIIFICFLCLLFVSNLIVYLISTFPGESLFLVITACFYLLYFYMGLALVRVKKFWVINALTVIYLVWGVVTLLVVPCYLYIKSGWLQ